ncbi:cupin [Rummeliibacillus sp. TYF005]|uniref:cupin domain-containing protein n=1 Tax=unclassified Rummeliibacillus TaxID=2622809 RepID=UPI000E665BEA|nr:MULTISPECIES: cupin [unclassified Rummeliibacillus]RIJ63338.1 cupin [Rummeliibacillus sp. POC4]RPJ96107.1 cupin [Rummeliibacillus sp. TYF005]
MKILEFGKEKAKEITNYNSVSAFYSKLMKTQSPTNMGFINIEQGGIVGYHKAPVPQLFIVVEGEGWVEGEDQKRKAIKSGQGVFWKKGEGHISGSETGLTALVLQAEELENPLK